MLKKLLKYDVRSIWKLWLGLSIAVLGMSLITSLVWRSIIELALLDTEGTSISFGFAMLGFASSAFITVLSWASMLLAVPLMCFIRYYKNFFSDEGYLTFTLPVRRKTLYLSKTVNVFIFSVANVIVTALAVLIMMLIIPATENGQIINFVAFDALGELFKVIWEAIHSWIFAYILELLLLAVVITLYQIGIIHFCITVGATVAKKHKVLAGVGIYFGVSFAISTMSQMLRIFSIDAFMGYFELLAGSSETMAHIILLLTLLLISVIIGTVALIWHFSALHTIERKLNLA